MTVEATVVMVEIALEASTLDLGKYTVRKHLTPSLRKSKVPLGCLITLRLYTGLHSPFGRKALAWHGLVSVTVEATGIGEAALEATLDLRNYSLQ